MKFSPPEFEKLNDYYKSYWKYLNDDDLLESLKKQGLSTSTWLLSLTEESGNISYANGKWKLKEVIGHLSDTERILCYRALRFARNDKTPLEAFDENTYVSNSRFGELSLFDITEEWKSVRGATISLFSSMNDEMADRTGEANGILVSPRILLYFILVHERHHLGVIRERYLISA